MTQPQGRLIASLEWLQALYGESPLRRGPWLLSENPGLVCLEPESWLWRSYPRGF